MKIPGKFDDFVTFCKKILRADDNVTESFSGSPSKLKDLDRYCIVFSLIDNLFYLPDKWASRYIFAKTAY